jgi:hypothetical protein
MAATYYGAHVRRIRRGAGFDASLIVQRRNPMTGQWYDVESFSEMSDYAYSDSHRSAWGLSGRVGLDGYGETFPHPQPKAATFTPQNS